MELGFAVFLRTQTFHKNQANALTFDRKYDLLEVSGVEKNITQLMHCLNHQIRFSLYLQHF